MVNINGFRVIGENEQILGKVVELGSNGSNSFKIVEYYINEYNRYSSRKIEEFSLIFNDFTREERWDALKNEVSTYSRLIDICISETVAQILDAEI